MSELVSTHWLGEHIGEVRVVDASWYMPEDKRAPAKEFEAGHIPGAVFFDIGPPTSFFAVVWFASSFDGA